MKAMLESKRIKALNTNTFHQVFGSSGPFFPFGILIKADFWSSGLKMKHTERCSKRKFAPELWFRLHRFPSAWPQNSAMIFLPWTFCKNPQENPKCIPYTCILMLLGIGA